MPCLSTTPPLSSFREPTDNQSHFLIGLATNVPSCSFATNVLFSKVTKVLRLTLRCFKGQ